MIQSQFEGNLAKQLHSFGRKTSHRVQEMLCACLNALEYFQPLEKVNSLVFGAAPGGGTVPC